MSTPESRIHPTTPQLVKATSVAALAAGLILITTVLPAEYGIDPTGIGKRLGLDALAAEPAAEARPPASATIPAATPPAEASANAQATNAQTDIAAKAVAAFGHHAGQSFDTAAVSLRATPFRDDTLRLTLAPGKGAEVKAALKAGDGMVFHWKASGDVALDMHGERPDAKGTWTSYAVESAQREASGRFIAPFDGSHGWYWLNRGTAPVTVEIRVAGDQEKLYRP